MSVTSSEGGRVSRRHVSVMTFAQADAEDREYWRAQTPLARLRHVEYLRELNYGPEVLNQRLQRVLTVVERPRR